MAESQARAVTAPVQRTTTGNAPQRAEFAHERLTGRFHVDLERGSIWLDDRRVLLLQSEWFADLRNELIDQLGVDASRRLLTQLGYRAGTRDALLAIKLNPDAHVLDLIYTGQSFHAVRADRILTTLAD